MGVGYYARSHFFMERNYEELEEAKGLEEEDKEREEIMKKTNHTPKGPVKNGSFVHLMKGPHMKTGRPSMRKIKGA